MLITQAIIKLDKLIAAQLELILQHSSFKALFNRWLGLHYLVDIGRNSPDSNVRVLNLSWVELTQNINKNADFETSCLFSKLYKQEYDHPGGKPFSTLITDYDIELTPKGIYYLSYIAQIMEASFCTFVINVLEKDTFKDGASRLKSAAWNSFRTKNYSRFIALIQPKLLFSSYLNSLGSLQATTVKQTQPWLPASFGFGGNLLKNFQSSHWFLKIGVERNNENACGNIPLLISEPLKGLTENFYDETDEKYFAQLGVITLVQLPLTTHAKLLISHSATSEHRNNDLSHTLSYLLCICRFAHHLKAIQRQFIGGLKTADECQAVLDEWLFHYTASNNDLPMSYRYKYPLVEYNISVSEKPGLMNHYCFNIQLKPYTSTNHAILSIAITTELKLHTRRTL